MADFYRREAVSWTVDFLNSDAPDFSSVGRNGAKTDASKGETGVSQSDLLELPLF